MLISTLLSGLQWTEADGVVEYLRLMLLHKPYILLIMIIIFLLSGIMMQIGKHHFKLSYYEISIIWLAASWVPYVTLWIRYGIKPSGPEMIGIIFCQVGVVISTISRVAVK